MIMFQFRVGHPKSPITVTIQEELVEDAIEALREFEEQYDEEDITPPLSSGPVPGGWKPPTIN